MTMNFDDLIKGIHTGGGPVISDGEPMIIIDGYKRTLTPEAGFETQIGVTNDYNTNEITFKCDKVIEGHDLSACKNKVIKWHNQASNAMGSDTLVVSNSTENNFTMTWCIPPEALTKAGILKIAVCFFDLTDTGKVAYKWNSLVYSGFQVAQGMDIVGVVGVPLSNIIDVDVYTRKITLPENFNTTIGIQGAPGAVKLAFRINRFYNDWDLLNSEESYIMYSVNSVQKKNKITVFKTIESLSGNIKDDWIEFEWQVPSELFYYPGTFPISIGFKDGDKTWRAKELTSLTIEESAFGNNSQIPETSELGWLFISQDDLTKLLNSEYGE